VIAYVDASLLARAYLDDEEGSAEAQRLLANRSVAKYTGRWTRIEVSGAIVRAARGGRRVPIERKLAVLDRDLRRDGGRVKVIVDPAEQVEATALDLARMHGLRALDALHLALASIAIPPLADRGEPLGFASRDGEQGAVAESLGFVRV
jgi:predicted nucleic acid-binding protein